MTVLLIGREVVLPRFHSGPVLAYGNRELDAWMGVYMADDVCLGVLNTQSRPEIRNGQYGQYLKLWAKMSLNVMSIPAEIRLSGNAWAPRNGGLAEFVFAVTSGEHEWKISATMNNGMLDGTVETAGETIPLKIPVGKDVLLSGNLGTATMNVPALSPGQEIFVDTFDPMSLSVTKAKINCIGEETLVYGGKPIKTKVLLTTVSGIASKAWVSYEDEVIRAETPFGFMVKKITAEEAMTALKPADTESLAKVIAVQPTGKKPRRGAAFMRLRMDGFTKENEPPTDDTQRIGGQNRYAIRVPEEPVLATGPVLSDADRAAVLASDAFIQSDHPKIKAMAAEIVGDEPDTWKRALRIYDWVYANIKKKAVLSLPSALDVLQTKEGDCNEHTVLYAALARAAGVPTRIAIGVVWSDELDGFFYHAWPEVYVGRWTWMDPTLGQPVADATHIKLLSGSIEKWSQLLPFLGRLKIDVIDVESGNATTRSKS